MTKGFREPKLYREEPGICAKPGCGGQLFFKHEDGWQCLNCMKIMYKSNCRTSSKVFVKRYGHYKGFGE